MQRHALVMVSECHRESGWDCRASDSGMFSLPGSLDENALSRTHFLLTDDMEIQTDVGGDKRTGCEAQCLDRMTVGENGEAVRQPFDIDSDRNVAGFVAERTDNAPEEVEAIGNVGWKEE
jgi:hypothetical protein